MLWTNREPGLNLGAHTRMQTRHFLHQGSLALEEKKKKPKPKSRASGPDGAAWKSKHEALCSGWACPAGLQQEGFPSRRAGSAIGGGGSPTPVGASATEGGALPGVW